MLYTRLQRECRIFVSIVFVAVSGLHAVCVLRGSGIDEKAENGSRVTADNLHMVTPLYLAGRKKDHSASTALSIRLSPVQGSLCLLDNCDLSVHLWAKNTRVCKVC